MTTEIGPARSSEVPAVASFLNSVFKVPSNAGFDSDLLAWKYFAPGPAWPEGRSYLLRKGNEIRAHCGVVPFELKLAPGKVSCVYLADWASDARFPGVGVVLIKKLLLRADVAIVVGGSDEARAILPRIGFRQIGNVTTLGRVVRPWRQFRTRPHESVTRSSARLLRNTLWRCLSVRKTPPGWSAMRTSHIGSEFEDVVYPESPKPWRTHDYLNYWLNCPAATMSCFKIMRNGKAMGYFLSSRVGRQMRIADIRVASDDVADWTSAYTLAANTAAGEADVCEISAAGSTALSRKSLLASGFRDRGAVPLFLHGSNTILNRIDSIFWNMIDGDAAYLSDPSHPYVT